MKNLFFEEKFDELIDTIEDGDVDFEDLNDSEQFFYLSSLIRVNRFTKVERLIEGLPNRTHLIDIRGHLAFAKGDIHTALEHYTNLYLLEPTSNKYRTTLGTIHFKLNNDDEAKRLFSEVLDNYTFTGDMEQDCYYYEALLKQQIIHFVEIASLEAKGKMEEAARLSITVTRTYIDPEKITQASFYLSNLVGLWKMYNPHLEDLKRKYR